MASGKKTRNTVMVLRPGQMAQSIRDNTTMEISMARDSSHGLMVANSMVISRTIRFRVMEFILGLMKESLSVRGSTTKWMVKEFSLGKMAENTTENTRMTKNMDLVFLFGQMAANTKANG